MTIAVPCFNGAQALPISVNSLLAQTYHAVNLLIANDGSEDESLEIIKKFAAANNKIQYLDLPRNNASKTRNIILEKAKDYDFLCWCDCGDELLPNAIFSMVYQAQLKQVNGSEKIVVLPLREIRTPNGKKCFTSKISR
ncbi:glycosyltransferase family A protein [Paraglaciecola aquimarina]|uniref:Glycosyltransferase family A protein n=1 Tax=Paraglaciecola aquimarina TaxID=1235557 RepID=A0ABU3T0D3_9ALTE|nr:glycosyltransferase family A protein [Paraglaciecola aquimarina]MDU0355701.1 glycosyltransferase family A protein [Paraglaciecola aquimarina]